MASGIKDSINNPDMVNVDTSVKVEKAEIVNKVTTGKVSAKKTSKFKDVFLAEDASHVKEFIFFDVIIPGLKDLMSNILHSSINMIFYGDGSHGEGKKYKSGGGSFVNYSSISSNKKPAYSSPSSKDRHSVNEVVFESRPDAVTVLDTMNEILEHYHFISVGDFYELAGVDATFADQKYGWTDLSDAKVMWDRDGYYINLPRVSPRE